MITEPTVRRVAYSVFDAGDVEDIMPIDPATADADNAAVFAGRACYQSFAKSYAPTAADADYIASTVHSAKHYSVIEHTGAAFYVTGVSRSLTHELVRHRQMGYSQLSQRYVASNDVDWVCPPEYLGEGCAPERAVLESTMKDAKERYDWLTEQSAKNLLFENITTTEARKRARQSARSVLPNCTETRLVISGNHRAWLEAMGKRWAGGAEPEIRRLFGKHILPLLRELAPEIYREVPEDYRLTGVPKLGLGDRVLIDGQLYEPFLAWPFDDNHDGEFAWSFRPVTP